MNPKDPSIHGNPIDEKWYRKIRQKYKDRIVNPVGVDPKEEPDGIIFSVKEINALLSQNPDEIVVYFGVVKTVDSDKKEYDRLTVALVGRKDEKDQLPSVDPAFQILENGTQCCPPKEELVFIPEE